jgi:hypothetical protein
LKAAPVSSDKPNAIAFSSRTTSFGAALACSIMAVIISAASTVSRSQSPIATPSDIPDAFAMR